MTMPSAFADKDSIHAIIETPRGSGNKYKLDEATGFFKLKRPLPLGLFFPLDFGFIPQTLAEDGDPLDVLVLMEEPGFPGCLVECRAIGIITAEQEKKGKLIRNDRVMAVAKESREYSSLQSIKDFKKELLDDIIEFFETYHKRSGEKFKVLGIESKEKAIKLIKENLKP